MAVPLFALTDLLFHYTGNVTAGMIAVITLMRNIVTSPQAALAILDTQATHPATRAPTPQALANVMH